MKFEEYCDQADRFARYPGRLTNAGLLYCGLGLGEAGEVQGEIKKFVRDDAGHMTESRREKIVDELGDNFWYIIQTLKELGVDPSVMMDKNISKLATRHAAKDW